MVVSRYDREVARDVYARVGEMDKVLRIDRQAFDECPSQKTLDRALSSGVEDKAALIRQAAYRIDTFGSDYSFPLFLMHRGETEAVRDWMASRGYVPRERYARGVSDTLTPVMEFMDRGLRRDTVLLARRPGRSWPPRGRTTIAAVRSVRRLEENPEAVPDDMEPQERYMVRFTEEHKRFSKFWSLYHGS